MASNLLLAGNYPIFIKKLALFVILLTILSTVGDVVVLAFLLDVLGSYTYHHLITTFSLALFSLDFIGLTLLAFIVARLLLPLKPLVDWASTTKSLKAIPQPNRISRVVAQVYLLVNGILSRLRHTQQHVINTERLQATKLSAQLAHEINQPLNVAVNYIDGCIEQLKTMQIPAKIITSMEEASLQVKRAGNIVHNLRDFIRNGSMQKVPVDLNIIVSELLKLFEPKLNETDIALRLKLSEQLPAVTADKLQIQQVICNLVQNAIDAMQTQTNIAHRLTIQTRQCADTAAVQIIVIDTGSGIAQELASRLFEPFVTTKSQGMGLGLSTAQAITKAHGGELILASTESGLTQFMVTLPIHREQASVC